MSGSTRGGLKAVSVLLDGAILGLLAVIVFILITGGGAFQLGSIRLRLRSVDNPIWELAALLGLRFLLRRQAPFLGLPRLDLSNVDRLSLSIARGVLSRLGTAEARRWILAACVVAVAVKTLLAWSLPGFFSGDDVEIHDMTLGTLLGRPWPVWELRSPFFPIGFILPAQRLALALGASRPEDLVFAGRLVVVLLSTLAIPLTWLAARRLSTEASGIPLLAALLFAVNKLHMSFGSSELPRPVSTVFVLSSFIALTGPAPRAAIGGALLGCAAAFRFSEAIFVLPAAVLLMTSAHWNRIPALVAGWTISAGLIIGISDYLYWGAPFSSLLRAADYTVVDRLSSRGYEPVYQYVALVPAWSHWAIVGLAILGSWKSRVLLAWTWLPIALLSCLPHKESRYLIPVMPFVAIAAATGFHGVVQAARAPGPSRLATATGIALVPLVLLACLHDVGGWRLVRSNEEVRLAQFLNAQGREGIAVEQAWRLGGQPYLSTHDLIVDISPDRLRDARSRSDAFKDVRWIALTSASARRLDPAEMQALGFERDAAWQGQSYWLFTRIAR